MNNESSACNFKYVIANGSHGCTVVGNPGRSLGF